MSPHSPVRFPCPSCGSPLRLRERRFVGATFPCPECGTPLTLLSLADGQATVQLAAVKAAEPVALPPVGRPRSIGVGLASPVLIGWAVALLGGGLLIGLAMSSGRKPKTEVATEINPIPQNVVAPVTTPPPAVVDDAPTEAIVAVDPPAPPIAPPRIAFDEPQEPPVSALAVLPTIPQIPVVTLPSPQAVLGQRLTRFDQTKPVPRRELLTTVEDLIGRKIEWTDDALKPATARLDEPVTVSLHDATVADLVAQVLAGTDLQLAITADGARLQRRATTIIPVADRTQILIPQ
ncbi:MAG: hypothetical protein SH850_29330 [Planctomycetaceae bacterium]|nr:hypothetical protein [Planctomycetaceae bacterium]